MCKKAIFENKYSSILYDILLKTKCIDMMSMKTFSKIWNLWPLVKGLNSLVGLNCKFCEHETNLTKSFFHFLLCLEYMFRHDVIICYRITICFCMHDGKNVPCVKDLVYPGVEFSSNCYKV